MCQENGIATDLAVAVARVSPPRPRNVTATATQRTKLIDSAPPHLRLWLLLCSDLAIRSGTAAKIAPQNYDPQTRRLTFTTKCNNKQTLTATEELHKILSQPMSDQAAPYVSQLPNGNYSGARAKRAIGKAAYDRKTLGNAFARLRRDCGITRKLTPHDLRRTTAVAIYRLTGDIRKVQAALGHRQLNSTVWYLDHDLTQVDVQTFELAKLNPPTERIQ